MVRKAVDNFSTPLPQDANQATAVCPLVSVIVPVFNDGERLRLCLDALAAQTFPRDRFEVIVVDNGSREPPFWIRDEYPDIVLAEEKTPGSYAARNRGIALAKGELFAFTDADCVPDARWIENGVNALMADSAIGLVGGHIEFFFMDAQRPRIAELYDSIMYLDQHKAVKVTGFAATANMLTRRSVFDRVGLFDLSVKSGGDREWGQRVGAVGYRLLYAETVIVRHPARATFKEITTRNIRMLGGHHQLHAQQGLGRRWLQIVTELFYDLSPPVPFVRRLMKDQRIEGAGRKVLITLMHTWAKLINAWTRVRLGFGMKPTRS